MTTDESVGPDPLRPRQRPGVEVDARAATWESTVFAVTAGMSVRYLEVPANEVAAFLDAVDSGVLDDELARVATTPTGAVLDAPGRIRQLAAFDRLVRHALTRSERDPVTGRVMGSDWRPRKRERDDNAGRRGQDHGEQATPAGDSVVVTSPAAGSSTAAMVTSAAMSTAKRAWWSSPAVVGGAVVAVVVIAAGAVLLARQDTDPNVGAAAAAVTAASTAESSSVGSIAVSAPAAEPPPVTASPAQASTFEPAQSASSGSAPAEPGTTSAAPSSLSAASSTLAAAPQAPAGPVNPLAGTFAMTRTITDNSGNPNVAIGSVDTGTVTFTAECADPGCAVNGPWGAATVSGSQVSFSGTATEPCQDDSGTTVVDAWSVILQISGQEAGAVTGLTGTGTITVSELNGCDAEIHPLTQAYVLTRTG